MDIEYGECRFTQVEYRFTQVVFFCLITLTTIE